MTAFVPVAEVNVEALVIFGIVVAITLGITYWASKRTTVRHRVLGRGPRDHRSQNGFAIAGDYMSAASFLGIAGLIFLFGFDGFLYSVGFLVAFLTVLFLLTERMRNAGKFTIADVLSFRLKERPARVAAALGTLAVVAFYLIAQMVGAEPSSRPGRDRLQRRGDRDRRLHAHLRRLRRHARDDLGPDRQGGAADVGDHVLSLFVLARSAGTRSTSSTTRRRSPTIRRYLGPGLRFDNPIDTCRSVSAWCSGTAGLPHILMRFFTVPDAKAARSSVGWAVGLIGAFYVMTTFLGFGARAILGEAGTTGAVDEAGNLAAPLLAQEVGGGAGSVGGDAFLAIISAVAFATILAVVAGLVISASGAVAHDVWSNVIRKGRDSEHEEIYVAPDRRLHDRRDRDRDRGHRRLGPERLVHGRPRVRRGGERELPGAAPGADLEALQHHRCGLRRGVRRGQLDRHRADRARRRRDPIDQPDPAGDHLGPARLPRAASSARSSRRRRAARSATSRSSTSGPRPAWAPRRSASGARRRQRPRQSPPRRGSRRSRLALSPEGGAAELSARRPRQLVGELHDPRRLVGRGHRLHVLAELGRQRFVARAFAKDHDRPYHRASLGVGMRDRGGLCDRRVRQEGGLDLARADAEPDEVIMSSARPS